MAAVPVEQVHDGTRQQHQVGPVAGSLVFLVIEGVIAPPIWAPAGVLVQTSLSAERPTDGWRQSSPRMWSGRWFLLPNAANIRRWGEFVVHMVDMAIAKEMIITGINFPSDVDEIEASGLTSVPSVKVTPPRIRESSCAMECHVSQILDYGSRTIVIGEVVQMYVRDECLDARGRYVLPEVYQPIARLHANNYIVADNQFVLNKPDELVHYDIAAGYGEPPPEAKSTLDPGGIPLADGQNLG